MKVFIWFCKWIYSLIDCIESLISFLTFNLINSSFAFEFMFWIAKQECKIMKEK